MGWNKKELGKEPKSQEKSILDNFTNILEEIENEGLFSVASPKSSKVKHTKEVLETLLLQKADSIKETIEANKEVVKKCTKFWQTPNTTQESPNNGLSGHSLRKNDQSKIKGIPIQDFHDFLNNELSENDNLEMSVSNEVQKENLE